MNTTSILRHINATRCLRLLNRSGPLSRSDISRELNLTRTTVGHAIKVLLDSELAWEPTGLTEASRVGRPSVGVTLNPSGAYFVGLDISTSSLTAVLIDFSMTVRARFVVPIAPDFHDVDAVMDQLADLTKKAIQAAGKDRKRVQGIGLSVPGLVGRDGHVAIAPLLSWRNVDLRASLAIRLATELDIGVCNDAVALASAVCSTASEVETREMLLILMSEGIGSALVRQGRVVDGFNGYAGEIGQMVMAPTLVDNKPQTFQLLAGYRIFLPFLAPELPIADAILRLATDPNEPAGFAEALNCWAETLAVGFLNAVRMLDPERIVLGGVLAALYPRVAFRVEEILSRELAGLPFAGIQVTQYGAEGAAIGAAAMMRESLFDLPELAEQK